MAVIICITMKNHEMIEELIVETCFIGRSNRCDFTVTDLQVSARHGSFELNQSGQLIYKDLDSTNGSFLNGKSITETQIKINEILMIGGTLIKIHESKLTPEEHKAIGIGKPPLPDEIDLSFHSPLEFNPPEEKTGLTRFIKIDSKKN